MGVERPQFTGKSERRKRLSAVASRKEVLKRVRGCLRGDGEEKSVRDEAREEAGFVEGAG
jgi:hypothetical protein